MDQCTSKVGKAESNEWADAVEDGLREEGGNVI